MAKPTSCGIEALFLEKPLWQPPIDHGPFIITYYPRVRYPEDIITLFRYHTIWGRVACNLEEESYGNYSFSLKTKRDEIFLEQENLCDVNSNILEEAKKSNAMALACIFSFDKSPQLSMVMNVVINGTFDYMLRYYSYQKSLLYSHIENLRKEALKNHGGETK